MAFLCMCTYARMSKISREEVKVEGANSRKALTHTYTHLLHDVYTRILRPLSIELANISDVPGSFDELEDHHILDAIHVGRYVISHTLYWLQNRACIRSTSLVHDIAQSEEKSLMFCRAARILAVDPLPTKKWELQMRDQQLAHIRTWFRQTPLSKTPDAKDQGKRVSMSEARVPNTYATVSVLLQMVRDASRDQHLTEQDIHTGLVLPYGTTIDTFLTREHSRVVLARYIALRFTRLESNPQFRYTMDTAMPCLFEWLSAYALHGCSCAR